MQPDQSLAYSFCSTNQHCTKSHCYDKNSKLHPSMHPMRYPARVTTQKKSPSPSPRSIQSMQTGVSVSPGAFPYFCQYIKVDSLMCKVPQFLIEKDPTRSQDNLDVTREWICTKNGKANAERLGYDQLLARVCRAGIRSSSL